MLCINDVETKKKFDALASVVGETEAWRDFYEQNGVVRPPRLVLQKLEANENLLPNIVETEFLSDVEEEDVNVDALVNEYNSNLAMSAIRSFSERLGIPYEIISQEAASTLLNSTALPKGFYQSGKVYFIEGLFTKDTIFHEFAHPVIKQLVKDNFELAEKLYNEIDQATKDTIIKKYPQLKDDKARLIEETIVTKMTTLTDDVTTDFNTWGGKLYYHIKKLLRKLFGSKINISKLKHSTTLEELSKMINEGKEFNLDIEYLKSDIFTEFQNDYNELIDTIKTKSAEDIQKVIDEYYTLVNNQLIALNKSNDVWVSVTEGLTTEENDGVLQEIKKALNELSTLGKSTKTVKATIEEKITDPEKLEKQRTAITNQLTAFVETVAMAKQVLSLYDKKIDDLISQGLNNIRDFDVIFTIDKFVQDWDYYLFGDTTNPGMWYTLSLQSTHPAGKLLNELRDVIHGGQNPLLSKINNLKQDMVVEQLYNFAKESAQPMIEQYLSEMDKALERNDITYYDKLHLEVYGLTLDEKTELAILNSKEEKDLTEEELAQKEELTFRSLSGIDVSKETFISTFKGDLGNVNYLNDFFISRMQSQDTTIGQFHKFLASELMEVNGNTNAKVSAFQKRIDKLLKLAGEDNYVLGEGSFGKKLAQVDTVLNQNGEMHELYAYKQAFINWQVPLQTKERAYAKAKRAYNNNPNDANEKALEKARNELATFKRKYMHDDYLDEVYEADELLEKDEIGIEARKRLEEIYNEINLLREEGLDQQAVGNFTVNDELTLLFQKLSHLHQSFVNGVKKEGLDLQIAERLSEYRERKQKYYEWETDHESFDNAYIAYQNYLINEKKYPAGSEEFKAALDVWLVHNTVIELKEGYLEERKALMEERTLLLEPFTKANNDITDYQELYEQIYSILRDTKDPFNQYNGNELSPDKQKLVTQLHEKIEEQKQLQYTRSGLTFAQVEERDELFSIREERGLNATEFARFNELNQIYYNGLSNFGISEEDAERIREIDSLLAKQTDTSLTEHYRSSFLSFAQVADFYDVLKNYFKAMYNQDIDTMAIEDYMIDDILDNKIILKKLMDADSTFKTWFYDNHYLKPALEKDNEGNILGRYEKWTKTAAWSHTLPNNPNNIKARYNINYEGKMSGMGVLEVDGIPRVPSIKYRNRVVKEEYHTVPIERDFVDNNGNLVLANVDNRGKWLPKLSKSNDYRNKEFFDMYENNRPLWDVLQEFKNFKLDNQVGLDNSQKAYLNYPTVRVGATERYNMGFFKRIWQRLVELFKGAADDAELGFISRGRNLQGKYVSLTKPITGMYELDRNLVSTNIMLTEKEQLHSIETFKKLRESYSFANSLLEVAENLMFKGKAKTQRQKLKFWKSVKTGVSQYDVLNNIIDKYYDGEFALNEKSRTINITASKLNTIAGRINSFAYFAFNPASSITNYASGKVQLFTKIFDDRYYNFSSYLKGRRKAAIVMGKTVVENYGKSEASAQLQLMAVMDAVPDHSMKFIEKKGSKTLQQSLLNLDIAYADRKFFLNSIPVHAFYSLLANNKIKVNGKLQSLDELVELRDGVIHTKVGVPIEWSISYDAEGKIQLGENVKKLMFKHQDLLLKTIGMASEINTPEMYRHLRWRFIMNLMRFLPTMTLDKYGVTIKRGKIQKRMNHAINEKEYGIIVSSLMTLKELMTLNPNRLSKRDYMLALQTSIYISISILLRLARKGIIFNDDDEGENFYYDPEAEKIYSKLKNSTALPNMSFINPKYTKGIMFNENDYFKLQGLRLLLRVEREHNTFYPHMLAGPGLNIITGVTPAQGGLLEHIRELTNILLTAETEQYKQDAGPYTWQAKESDKWKNITLRALGFSGKLWDPAYAIELENKPR